MILTNSLLRAVQIDPSNCLLTEILWLTIPALACATTIELHLCVAYLAPNPLKVTGDVCCCGKVDIKISKYTMDLN